MRFIARHWPIALAAGFACAVYHAWLGLGLIIGDDFFRFSDAVLRSDFPWRTGWDSSFGFGLSTASTSLENPLWSAMGLLVRAGLPFTVVERLVWFWPLLVLLVVAPYALAYRMTHYPWAATLAAAVFAVNTWTVALVQRGHIASLVAYAIIPLVLLTCWKWLQTPTWRSSLLLAFTLWLAVMYDVRYAYMAGGLCFLFAAGWIIRLGSAGRRRRLPALLGGAAQTAVCFFVLNSYWLIPQVLEPAHLPAGYGSLTSLVASSSADSLAHAVALFMPYYHYIEGTLPFFAYPVEPAFYLLPLVALLGLIAARKNPYAIPLAIIAIAGIVIAAGPSAPFGAVVTWMFLHVPGMNFFRDISKFYALVALAYSSLIALGVAWLAAMLRARIGSRSKPAVALMAIGAIAAYAGLMHDAFNPLRFSDFATTTLSADDVAMQRFLDDQSGSFRTLLYPTWRPELVGSDRHPVVSASYWLDYTQPDQGAGDLFDPGAALPQRLASPLLPALLAEADVRFVILIDDRRGDIYTPGQFDLQYAQSLRLLRSLPWLHERARFGRYAVFSLQRPSDAALFFAREPAAIADDASHLIAFAGTPWWTVGRPAIVPSVSPLIASAFSRQPIDTIVASSTPSRARIIPGAEIWLHAHADAAALQPLAQDLFASSEDLTAVAPSADQRIPQAATQVEIDDPAIISAPYASADPTAHWLGLIHGRGIVHVVNLSGGPLDASIAFVAASPDGDAREVTMRLGGARESLNISAAPSAARVTTFEARLDPGSNDLAIDVSGGQGSGFQLLLRDDIRVAAGAPRIGRPAALPNSLASTSNGLHVRATIASVRTGTFETAAWRLLATKPVPLDDRPTIDIGYRAPAQPLTLALALQLKRESDGETAQTLVALPSASQRTTVDAFAAVQRALEADWQRVEATHARDVQWQRDRGRIGPEASDYDLRGVQLQLLAPVAAPPGIYDTTLYDASLATASATDQPQRRIASTRPVATRPMLPGGDRIAVDVPKWDAARKIVFWLGADGSAPPPEIQTQFSRDGVADRIVAAAGRPELTDPDVPMPPAWVTDVADAPGSPAHWRRYDLDLNAIRAYRLPDAGSGFALSRLVISSARATISDATLVGPAVDADQPTVARAYSLDDASVRSLAWREDADGGFTAHDASKTLPAGTHLVALARPVSLIVDGALIARPETPNDGGVVVSTDRHSPVEFEARTLDEGSPLLVFPQAFAPGWKLAALPLQAGPLTGNGFLDWLRIRGSFVPDLLHVAANGVFNAWIMPPGPGHYVLLYLPAVISDVCAVVWLVVSLALAGAVLLRTRPNNR